MQEILAVIEKNQQLILEAAQYVWRHPETGFKEHKTSAYLAEVFRTLGYNLVTADGIPGFYTIVDTKKPGPEILILGELDSVICPNHPDASPKTGAVHACGHNAQCAALVGIAAALRDPIVLGKFCGKIRLCAVPAEELLEIDYRSELRTQGKIKYFCGKSEFLSRGYFDDVDMAFMVHTSTGFAVGGGAIGCLTKQIVYKGTASHAGATPWNGKNALYAANCGLNAINAIRETFRESDAIRIHPIITNGGSMVNAIPEKTVMESYVRGANFDAICNANQKVNRALCGAALCLGTNIEIIDSPGYSPLINDENLKQIVTEAAHLAIPEYEFDSNDTISSGSTDMGDLSCVMPVVHPYVGGARGNFHGSDFEIADPVAACIASAKLQLAMLFLLLCDGAKRARKILEDYKPLFASKEDFLTFLDSLYQSGNRIEYNEDETAAHIIIT